MPRYTKPPTFATGQVLGRANVGILRDNDDFFNALADRRRQFTSGCWRGFIGTETNPSWHLWDGYHMLQADATTLHHWIDVDSDNDSEPLSLDLYYDYGGAGQVIVAACNTDGSDIGTYDLSSFYSTYGAGLYRVTCRMTRTDGNHSGTGLCMAPFTTYTGGLSYTSPPTITDGATGTATHFNTWRDNDNYFNAIWPQQTAFAGMSRPWIASEPTLELWSGMDKYHPDHERVYYKTTLSSNAGGNEIRIYYDYAGGDQRYTDINTEGTTSGYWDLPSTWTINTNYRIYVEKRRTDTGQGSTATLHYLYIGPASADAAYTVMNDFTVGQDVYGSTAGQLTRLDYLSDNDESIEDRLRWGSSSIGRMDIACMVPSFVRLGGTDTGNYHMKRYGDTLYYRTTSGILTLPDGTTESLDDYGASTYQTLDLNQIDLPYGGEYTISGSIYYAMEA